MYSSTDVVPSFNGPFPPACLFHTTALHIRRVYLRLLLIYNRVCLYDDFISHEVATDILTAGVLVM